ncbi:hypothetical protein APSETT445_000220 [Aspergillus pseudonomiae]
MLSLVLSAELTGSNTKSLEAAERRTLSGNASFAKSVCSFHKCFALPAANKCDQKTHSASIVAGPNVYEADEKRKGRKVIDIDCRGLEFTEFKADGEWEAKGTESSTPFTAIDLSESEWYDYDEKAGDEVSIKEITWEFQPVNPRPFLQTRVGTEMVIRLKWGQTEYKGKLESIDSYMNVLLRDTEEFIDGKNTGTLGLVLIRCNNILWMGSADNVEMTDLGLR